MLMLIINSKAFCKTDLEMISNANLLCKYKPALAHATHFYGDVECNIVKRDIVLYLILWNNLDNNWPVTCRFIARMNIDFHFLCAVLWLWHATGGLLAVCSISQKEPLHGRDSTAADRPPVRHHQKCRFAVRFLCFCGSECNAQFNSFLNGNSATNRKLYGFIIRTNSFVNGKLILALCMCNGSKWHG